MKQTFGLLFAILLVSVPSFGAVRTLSQVFEALRTSGEKYQIVGTVCEQVARLKMEESYPAPRYKVVTGIAYKIGDRVVGELDVVVFDGQNAILVGEVKCWNDLRGAQNKARDQRSRFMTNLQSGKNMQLDCTNGGCHYTKNNFRTVQKFISIAQQGGTQFGFDMDLDYSLKDLMGLRQKLITCQEQGQCTRAPR